VTVRGQVGDLKGGKQVSIAGVVVQVWKAGGKCLLSKGISKESDPGVAQPQVPPSEEGNTPSVSLCALTQQDKKQDRVKEW
jgi:hypothetical protein